MKDHEYTLLDVCTDRAFAGNPLAVFPQAEGLDTGTMQAIANELNLSETVFVGQARGLTVTPSVSSLPPWNCPSPATRR